jgi:hypothetical protein
MSKRISKERARLLRDRELELQQLQREGKSLPNSRRKKKYLIQVKKQKGYFAYLAERYKSHGHDKEIIDKFRELSR